VKDLRKAVLPEMIDGDLSDDEYSRRWRDLEDMYLAQQLSLYPPRYIASNPTVDRILETVERFAENLTGADQAHPPITTIVQVGETIDVDPKGRREAGDDPLLLGVEKQLETMLGELSGESLRYGGKYDGKYGAR